MRQAMKRGVGALAMAWMLLLASCGSLEVAHHKRLGDSVTVSVSEEGLSFWTEVHSSSAPILRQSMRVASRDREGFFKPEGFIESGLDSDIIAARRMAPAAMPLAPRAVAALEREASWMTPLRLQVSQSEEPAKDADIQLVPGVLLYAMGKGIVSFESQLFTRYLDDKGERQVRVYRYLGQYDLPWTGEGSTWTMDNHLPLKRQIDASFRALSKVMLRDVRGDFRDEVASPTPKLLKKESAGLIDVSTYELARFDQLRVAYQVVGRNRSMKDLLVLDDAPPSGVFGE